MFIRNLNGRHVHHDARFFVLDRWRAVVAVLLCFIAPLTLADSLDRINALVNGGAPNLALQILAQHQPGPSDPAVWMQWERKRIELYTAQSDWAAVVQRVDAVPAWLAPEFAAEMLEHGAIARLAQRDGMGARVYLRRLLWIQGGDNKDRRRWRELVIRSYLADDQAEDASRAVRRFINDFRPDDNAWSYLNARVLLESGDPVSAANAVAARGTHEGRLLHLVARLRSSEFAPARVITQARALAKEAGSQQKLQRRIWALLAEAAAQAEDLPLQIDALERALPIDDKLFEMSADTLWSAYLRNAEAIGNAKHLLIGDDHAWTLQAARFTKTTQNARSIYALLGLRANDPQLRDDAHRKLLESLQQNDRGELGFLLYGKTRQYPDYGSLPVSVRHVLSQQALAAQKIELAARLVDGVEQPPLGQSAEVWTLNRSRLAVYTGDHAQAVALLDQLLGTATLDAELAEKILQVAFDLQAVQRDEEALLIFQRVNKQAESEKIKRETLFWMAESHAALKRYALAAELYLRSAVYGDVDGYDLWGQTARYNAAGALAKAGLAGDARAVYAALLRVTDDPKRRAVIQREIQQSWLLGPKTTTQ